MYYKVQITYVRTHLRICYRPNIDSTTHYMTYGNKQTSKLLDIKPMPDYMHPQETILDVHFTVIWCAT